MSEKIILDIELKYYPYIEKKNDKLYFNKKVNKWIKYCIFVFTKDCDLESKRKEIINDFRKIKYFYGHKKDKLFFISPDNYHQIL